MKNITNASDYQESLTNAMLEELGRNYAVTTEYLRNLAKYFLEQPGPRLYFTIAERKWFLPREIGSIRLQEITVDSEEFMAEANDLSHEFSCADSGELTNK
ncbi:hypothetical protein Trydic_g19775 [Trypoxylus dichotomus]